MRAILLAAGFGTRLRPITEKIPKCLVPIKGRPLLDIWLGNLINNNIKRCLVNTHYLSHEVQRYLETSAYKDRVILSHENVLLGTAGTLTRNLEFFENNEGLLIHADNYSKFSIAELILAHHQRPKDCLITALAFRTERPFDCGIFRVNKDNVAVEFQEKNKKNIGNLANGAVYILSEEFLDVYRKKYINALDFSGEVLPQLIGKIYVHETAEIFLDVGTISNYIKANNV